VTLVYEGFDNPTKKAGIAGISRESLNKFLANSSFLFLNNGSDTRISASKNYISVPDLSITNCKNFKIKWSIGEDSMRSNHLPIIIDITNKFGILSNYTN